MKTIIVNVQLQFDADSNCDVKQAAMEQIDRVNELLSIAEDESQPQILGAENIDMSDITIQGEQDNED